MNSDIIQSMKDCCFPEGNKNHIALICRSNAKILAFGNNSMDSYFGMNSRHAEMDVLRKINVKYFRKSHKRLDLYVIRIAKDGRLCESKPCKYCIKMLAASGINLKWIYYSTNNGQIIRASLCNLLLGAQYISRGQR